MGEYASKQASQQASRLCSYRALWRTLGRQENSGFGDDESEVLTDVVADPSAETLQARWERWIWWTILWMICKCWKQYGSVKSLEILTRSGWRTSMDLKLMHVSWFSSWLISCIAPTLSLAILLLVHCVYWFSFHRVFFLGRIGCQDLSRGLLPWSRCGPSPVWFSPNFVETKFFLPVINPESLTAGRDSERSDWCGDEIFCIFEGYTGN